jgi:hypothetical protein
MRVFEAVITGLDGYNYHIRSVDGLLVGDPVTIDSRGYFKKAEAGDKVFGVVFESCLPMGCLAVTDERREENRLPLVLEGGE